MALWRRDHDGHPAGPGLVHHSDAGSQYTSFVFTAHLIEAGLQRHQRPRRPDGNTCLHPTPEPFSSPLTGSGFSVSYSSAAFESDTPRIEAPDVGGVCNRTTGAGCTIVPPTDDGVPATF